MEKADKKVKIFYNGEPAVLVAERNGISKMAFRDRLRHGWTVEEACTKCPRSKTRKEKYVYKDNFFQMKLYRLIKEELDKCLTDIEKAMVSRVVRICLEKRWSIEKQNHLNHLEFKRIQNYLHFMYYRLDIPEEDVDNMVKANTELINTKVDKLYPYFFGKNEHLRIEKCQKLNLSC